MSEAATETVGNPGEAGAPPPADAGSSFLSQAAETAPTPELATTDPVTGQEQQTAEGAVQETLDGPPEGVPEKFWDKEAKKVKVDDMAKGYTNLEKLLSREKVPVPQDDDDEEGWERWTAAVRPETEDAYDFGDKETEIPEGMSYDTELEKSFRNAAFAAGLHPKQANQLHDMFFKMQTERHAQWQKLQQENQTNLSHQLTREYGQELPAVKNRIGTLLNKYDDDKQFRGYLDESGLGDDPRMIRVMDKMARDMSGSAKLIGKPTETAAPQDVKLAISKFEEKNGKALFDRNHPQHSAVVAERNKLYEALHQEG